MNGSVFGYFRESKSIGIENGFTQVRVWVVSYSRDVSGIHHYEKKYFILPYNRPISSAETQAVANLFASHQKGEWWSISLLEVNPEDDREKWPPEIQDEIKMMHE